MPAYGQSPWGNVEPPNMSAVAMNAARLRYMQSTAQLRAAQMEQMKALAMGQLALRQHIADAQLSRYKAAQTASEARSSLDASKERLEIPAKAAESNAKADQTNQQSRMADIASKAAMYQKGLMSPEIGNQQSTLQGAAGLLRNNNLMDDAPPADFQSPLPESAQPPTTDMSRGALLAGLAALQRGQTMGMINSNPRAAESFATPMNVPPNNMAISKDDGSLVGFNPYEKPAPPPNMGSSDAALVRLMGDGTVNTPDPNHPDPKNDALYAAGMAAIRRSQAGRGEVSTGAVSQNPPMQGQPNPPSSGASMYQPGQVIPGRGGKQYRYKGGPANSPSSFEEVTGGDQ